MSVSYGGQAVLEGVMMRGPAVWSVAVRTPNGEIVEVTKSVVSPMQRHPHLAAARDPWRRRPR